MVRSERLDPSSIEMVTFVAEAAQRSTSSDTRGDVGAIDATLSRVVIRALVPSPDSSMTSSSSQETPVHGSSLQLDGTIVISRSAAAFAGSSASALEVATRSASPAHVAMRCAVSRDAFRVARARRTTEFRANA